MLPKIIRILPAHGFLWWFVAGICIFEPIDALSSEASQYVSF
jgi:hypothetical protein